MNLPQYQTARVLKNTALNATVRHLKVYSSPSLPFISGQFFLLRLRGADGEFVERSYSAANFSSGDLLEFLIRIEPHGKMSALIDRLKSDDVIDIKGPFGRFGSQSVPPDWEKLVLIAGGVGIAPFRSMLQRIMRDFSARPAQKTSNSVEMTEKIQLFYGFRTLRDFLFQQELEAMKRDLPLKIITAISEEQRSTSWSGNRGTIVDFLEPTIFPPSEKTYALLCGPPPMVKVAQEKLAAFGYAKTHVHLEAW